MWHALNILLWFCQIYMEHYNEVCIFGYPQGCPTRLISSHGANIIIQSDMTMEVQHMVKPWQLQLINKSIYCKTRNICELKISQIKSNRPTVLIRGLNILRMWTGHMGWNRMYWHKLTWKGGQGTQIWFGQGCAALASKPLPIFKGHFGRKWYPLLRIFLEKWANFSQILRFSGFSHLGSVRKLDPCLRILL